MRQVTTEHYAQASDVAVRPNAPAVDAPEIVEGACEPVIHEGQDVTFRVSNLNEEERGVIQTLLALGVTPEATGIITIIGLTQDPDAITEAVIEVKVDDADWCVISKEWVKGHEDLLSQRLWYDPVAIALLISASE